MELKWALVLRYTDLVRRIAILDLRAVQRVYPVG